MDARRELLARMDRWARDKPAVLAVASEAGEASFSELVELTRNIRDLVRDALPEAPRIVAFALPAGPKAVAAELAIWAEGHAAAALPLNCTTKEAAEFLNTLPSAALLIEPHEENIWKAIARLQGRVEIGAGWIHVPQQSDQLIELGDDLLQVQFTSGSTGVPKAVVFDASGILAGLNQTEAWYAEIPSAPAFSTMPQQHAMGRERGYIRLLRKGSLPAN